MSLDRRRHWEDVYTTKDEKEVSWFEENPAISLALIRSTGLNRGSSIIDVGGGASRLVDALIDEGFQAVTVLDISEKAMAIAKARLGALGTSVRWVVADVTKWEPSETYDVWHDRAALHFLAESKDRIAYAQRVHRAVRAGGHVIIGTFAPDGPERCSGLQVVRHSAASLGEMLGGEFELMESRPSVHLTPTGATQRFQFSRFRLSAKRQAPFKTRE
jgi:SAM-dependent methyltransferase